jgi:hypothetical protein
VRAGNGAEIERGNFSFSDLPRSTTRHRAGRLAVFAAIYGGALCPFILSQRTAAISSAVVQ